jgi:hypothetical protein
MGVDRSAGRRVRVGLLPAVAILLVAGPWSAATPAAGADAPPYVSEFTFSPHEGPPGVAITIEGTCLWGGAPVGGGHVIFASPGEQRVAIGANLPTDASGHVTGAIAVPTNASPGTYLLGIDCWYDDVLFGSHDFPFVVTPGPAGSSTTTTVPATTTSMGLTSTTATTMTPTTTVDPDSTTTMVVSATVRSAPTPAQPATPVVVADVTLTG